MINIEELSFEQAFKKLEELSAQLESGKLPLEELLEKYELCRKLLDRCNALLDTAEQKVSQLKRNSDGSHEELPFNEE